MEDQRAAAQARPHEKGREIAALPTQEEAEALRRASGLARAGRRAEAEAAYRALIAASPDFAAAQYEIGILQHEAGHHPEALACYDAAIAIAPHFAAAHSNRSGLLRQMGKFAAAREGIARAVALEPGNAGYHNNLGASCLDLNQPAEAVASFAAALAITPDDLPTLWNHAHALLLTGRTEEALAGFGRAIALAPDRAEPLTQRALALRRLRRTEAALADCDAAVALEPDNAAAQYWRAGVLADLSRIPESLATYDRAIALRPDYAEAWCDRGYARVLGGDLDGALEDYGKSLAIAPRRPETHRNRAHTLLRLGRWAEGLEEFDWRPRHDTTSLADNFTAPELRSLAEARGKRVFLHWEQGFGDTIQFSRYAIMLAESGAVVTMSVQSPLRGLMRQLEPRLRVIATGGDPGDYDFRAGLMGLPRLFGTTPATIPGTPRYLAADPGRVAEWAGLLGPKPGKRIGLVWRGNPNHSNDARRSIALAAMLPLADAYTPGRFIAVQHQPDVAERAALAAHGRVELPPREPADFADLAGLLANLDLLVTVDTALAHLAGALGVPCWVLLPPNADWRWLRHGEETDWYPTLRLFRQEEGGSWETPLRRISRALWQSFGAG